MSDTTRGAAFYWTLPVEGDGRQGGVAGRPHRSFVAGLRDDRRDRFTHNDYLFQVARAAESAGFTGVLVPWNERGDDSWIVAASLARQLRRLVLVPEVQPGFATPVYFAKMSATFQRFAGDRLGWKIDLERDPAVRRAHGDLLEGDDWFARAGEFVAATKGVWSEDPFNHDGRFYGVEAGGLKAPLAGRQPPPVFSSGGSDAALAFAARHADVHLLDLAPNAELRTQIDRLDRAAAAAGRVVKRGLRLGVIARPTDGEAWEEARVAWNQATEGSDGGFDGQRADDHLWSGFSRLGLVAATGLVGSHDTVARRIDELGSAGIEAFVLDGAPRLEEAYRFGEQIFSRLATRSWSTLAPRAA